jgi:hypothetical protein
MSDLPQTLDSFRPALHLIYANPEISPQDQAKLASRLQAFGSLAQSDPNLIWQIRSREKCLGKLSFTTHQIQISGLATPLPPTVIDRTVNVSLWQPQIKAGMRRHQSHLSLVYNGQSRDPVEKMIALYQTAYGFRDENLLGIVNEPAWTAHPTAGFLSIDKIEEFCQEIPFILWFGYVRIFVDKQRYWLVTKGHHLFDVPDLACFLESGEEEERVINTFINLFYYLFEQDVVARPGDTLEIGNSGVVMQFSEVTEYEETLLGPAGTLVIEQKDQRGVRDQDTSG